ncbi:MAG TPA: deoxyguanosinetriphosphate triphosphohydrolase [Candidatus Omnitrophota bacterium]|nr:deoxyguanosinetriphosphate triphosphohydrolase [Candidatus Omnitrophota bacterium]HPD83904.1 deoxyguanosinetriphosphate triphosphohydrolase [Candidatus Omnitrophota bacterium]HRZ02761.1 deoxyguanosinetriphosphate triphosphohydrolase [Candidatus Omnitrophota bacterium]
MQVRKEIEALEDKILAPYAMKSKDSSGRVYAEPDHETRTCYQRDRDRIVHSEAFRKLEYKTQVFIIYEGDYYRTRLTHTLEVAQIARTIGRNLRLNEDLIEAIALAHDLGHPPFGHAGERTLNDIMKEAGLKAFNHNQRSFEIVTKFEKRYPHFDGLNLTLEVLVGILKHKTIYDVPEVTNKTIQEGPTLEAQVVDVADSLAYLNHDIDDGLTSGCIVENDLMDSALWRRALDRLKTASATTDKEMLKYQIVKELIDMQAKDLLFNSDQMIGEANFQSAQEVKKSKKVVIGFSSQMAAERDELQRLVHEKFYCHYRVERMISKAQRIIKDIFKVYKENPNQLPYSVYQRNKKYDDKTQYEIICNYIAGMTDRFALDEHKKLFNPYEKV